MMTSLYPARHGCSLVGGTKLRRRVTTLAEILRNEGYATHAITTILYLTATYGFDQGFERLLALGHRASADRVTDEALRWLARNRDRRFFLFLHFYDVHSDYSPPQPYRSRFDPDYKGPIDGTVQNLLKYQGRLTKADVRHLEALYDGEIAYVDHALGRLFGALEEMGLIRDTLIVLTSDHGEEFREHGSFGHGFTLYDEQLLVPLIFSWPGRIPSGRRVETPVRLIDVVPTLLQLLGLGGRLVPGRLDGRSLVPLVKGEGPPWIPSPLAAFSQTELGGRELYALRTDRFKVIYDAGSEAWEFYDLSRDPGEKRNLGRDGAGAFTALAEELRAYREKASRSSGIGSAAGEKVRLDRDSIQTLKSLGYIQ